MPIIPSAPDLASGGARANAAAWASLREELQVRRAEAAAGGSPRARERHVARGKLLPRDRVIRLLDPGSPFLEIGALAAYDMYGGDIHAAGLVAGIGRVSGRECMIVCNDVTIKGGTYYPLTVKKHLRAQEIARENNLPCLSPGEHVAKGRRLAVVEAMKMEHALLAPADAIVGEVLVELDAQVAEGARLITFVTETPHG